MYQWKDLEWTDSMKDTGDMKKPFITSKFHFHRFPALIHFLMVKHYPGTKLAAEHIEELHKGKHMKLGERQHIT
jgi:hypothetical protein